MKKGTETGSTLPSQSAGKHVGSPALLLAGLLVLRACVHSDLFNMERSCRIVARMLGLQLSVWVCLFVFNEKQF